MLQKLRSPNPSHSTVAPYLSPFLAAALTLSLFVVAVHAPAVRADHRTPSDRVILQGCQDSFAPIPASAAEVRRHVPDIDESRYRILGEDLAVATLVVRIFACDSLEVPGSPPRPTLSAQFGVAIESPDGTGRVLGSDACCNWYTFFWVTDNQDFAGWLKDGTGLGGVVRYVRQLVYRYEPGLGSGTAAIYFAASEPTPSPFELEATVVTPLEPWPGAEISPNWWAETEHGSIKIANDVPAFRPYEANGEVRTRTGTQMAALFGAEREPFGSPFSYGRWDRSFTTKGTFRSRGRRHVRPRRTERPPRLRPRVRPRTVRAGRRTRFVWHVTARRAGRVRPVRGALVRFAGKRRRTSRRGRAVIVTTLARPGRIRARVTRRGYRPGATSVRVAETGPDGYES